MKKTLTVFSAILMSVAPIFAIEDCTVARTANYKTGPDYQVNKAQSGQSYQLILEMSALIFRRGKTIPVFNELAQSVSYLNEGKTMLINMRRNCGWSDGAPITAHEVVEGIRRTFSEGPESSNVGRNFIKNGKEIIEGRADLSTLGVRVIDDYSFEIDLEANGELMEKILSRINYTPFPLHLPQIDQGIWDQGYLKRVSSGPYYVTDINETEVKLKKNPYFCKDIQPQIENLVYYNVKNSDVQTGLFFNKKINLAERFNNRTLRAFEIREDNITFKKRDLSSEVVTFLLQSQKGKLMDNSDLREALLLAIDLDEFSKVLDLDKNFLAQKGALSYPYPGYNAPKDLLFVQSYPERLKRAQAIMSKQKITPENPLIIQIVALERPDFEQVKILLQSMWSQINVKAEFQIIQPQFFSWKELEEWPGGYDYFLVGMESDFPDPSDFLSWLNIHGADNNKEEMQDHIHSTFKMVNDSERLQELRNIEVKMRQNRTFLALFATSTPWIIDQSLEFGAYFHLTGINLKSETCKKAVTR